MFGFEEKLRMKTTTMMMRWFEHSGEERKEKLLISLPLLDIFLCLSFPKNPSSHFLFSYVFPPNIFQSSLMCGPASESSSFVRPFHSSTYNIHPHFSMLCVVCLNVCFFSSSTWTLARCLYTTTDVKEREDMCRAVSSEGRSGGTVGSVSRSVWRWLSGEWKILPNYIFQQHKTLVWFFPVYPLNEYICAYFIRLRMWSFSETRTESDEERPRACVWVVWVGVVGRREMTCRPIQPFRSNEKPYWILFTKFHQFE